MLQRTQILLDQQTKQDLHLLSQTSNQSISSLVRELVSQGIKKKKKASLRKTKISGAEAMLQMAERAKKLGLSGPKDLSKNHDHYLYGAPKHT